MIYYQSEDDVLSECSRLLREDLTPSQDRANISAFYNGQETLSQDEAEERNVSSLTNHLLGHDSLKAAHEQIFNIYVRPKELWGLTIESGPWEEVIRDSWGMRMSQKINQIIKRSRRLKPEWNGVSGEITLHGRAVMLHQDNFDWCPMMRMLYVPRGTGTTPESITYGCIPDRLHVADLERYMKMAKDKGPWNKPAIEQALKFLKNPEEPPMQQQNAQSSVVEKSPETREYDVQSGIGCSTTHRTSIPVFYFYEVDHSKPDKPVSMTIVADYTHDYTDKLEEMGELPEKTLFKKEAHFKSVNQWAHLFFIDCNIGGPTSYHRTLGLGRLNYEADVDIEEFFNEYLQGIREAMRRVWKMKNSSDIETARQFQSEFQNIIPEGFDAVQFQHIPNFQHALAPLQFLRQQTKANAGSSFNNLGVGTSEELEVQAIERQSRSASAVASKMADIYECLDALGEEIVRRFVFAPNVPSSPGYRDVKEFRDWAEENQIPIEEIAKMRNGKFCYLKIRTSREAGDGNAVMENMVNGALIQNLSLYSPEAQQLIKRKFTASLTKDSDLAEVLVPYQQEPDPDQEMDADQESDLAMREGILGVPIPTRRKDIHMRHIPRHMRALQALLAKGEVRGWDQMDMAGFQTLGAHVVLHIQAHGANPANSQEARGLMQGLQNMASQAEKFVQNMQQQQESQQLSPLDQEKIITMQHRRGMEERKQSALEQSRANRERMDMMEFASKELDSAEQPQENPSNERGFGQ